MTLSLEELDARLKKVESIVFPTTPTSILLQDSFDIPWMLLKEGTQTPNGLWYLKYLSGGIVQSVNGECHMAPGTVSSPDQTRAPELLSVGDFSNFQLDFDMRTNKQLRTGSKPNAWETAWILFRFTDEAPKSNHHYYFTLKTNGCEFGKKDTPPGSTELEKQIFLKTPSFPVVTIGHYQHITIIANKFHITIKVNGTTVVDMDDPQVNNPELMSHGKIGLYAEDADVSFDNIKLTNL